MEAHTILFDLDGTLTDPGEGITKSVAYALASFGITVQDRRTLYPFIGPPLVESFMGFYGFTAEQAERRWKSTGSISASRGSLKTPRIRASTRHWRSLQRAGEAAAAGHQQAHGLRPADLGAVRLAALL